jgi:hypothetical protein
VAVVQISKIQIRRGQKNSSSGVPQLSSAELAWAVDSQELFIGNGSVQEGAPYVGNTKVLTEHDNILELANSYRFASDDPSITLSTPRPLLGKVDEIQVSVADFGAVADGSTDNVTAFENALNELFRNVDPKYKKVLLVPNGEYLFTSDLEIPSNAIIRGETATGAILNFDTNNILFVTSTGDSLINFNSSNRPQNIEIHNLTIKRSSGQTVITGMTDSKFNGVIFQGEYSLGQTPASLNTEPSAVFWANDIVGISVTDVVFDNCQFLNNSISLKCAQTIVADTSIQVKNSKFFVNDTGIFVTGVVGQKNSWSITDTQFEELFTQALRSTHGYGTRLQRCNFKNCGNGVNSANTPLTPIVYFGESRDNIVINCTSNRQQLAGVTSDESDRSITDVFNSDKTELIDRNYSDIFVTDSFRPVAVISALNNYTTINYTLRLGDHIRHGNINLAVGDDLSKLAITDNYQYSDISASSPGGVLMTNFEFSASLRDNDSDSGVETIVLYYKNPIASGAAGDITFDVTYGV